jgi:hypothetical protein
MEIRGTRRGGFQALADPVRQHHTEHPSPLLHSSPVKPIPSLFLGIIDSSTKIRACQLPAIAAPTSLLIYLCETKAPPTDLKPDPTCTGIPAAWRLESAIPRPRQMLASRCPEHDNNNRPWQRKGNPAHDGAARASSQRERTTTRPSRRPRRLVSTTMSWTFWRPRLQSRSRHRLRAPSLPLHPSSSPKSTWPRRKDGRKHTTTAKGVLRCVAEGRSARASGLETEEDYPT